MPNTANKAIFLDRDGTLNEDTGYVYTLEAFKWLPGVIQALKLFKEAGYLLIVVSNQSGIARNYYTTQDLMLLQDQVNAELATHNATIDFWYHCPHLPEITGPCSCRKPAPGLLLDAIKAHNIDPKRSYMIGDRFKDVQAGKAASVTPIKLGLGQDPEDLKAQELGSLIFPDLLTAAKFILDQA